MVTSVLSVAFLLRADHRGSYMSTHVLLNLLNELGGKKIRSEALPSMLSIPPNKFNKFSNAQARMQVSVCHLILNGF